MAANGWKKIKRKIREMLESPPDWSDKNDGVKKKRKSNLINVRKKQGEGFWQADIGD